MTRGVRVARGARERTYNLTCAYDCYPPHIFAMSSDNTVAIQVTSDDPKKKEKAEQNDKSKPDGKEQDGEDLVGIRVHTTIINVH